MTSKKSEALEPKASDAAKQRADELGVDLADVEPTGSGGQIKVEDVENAESPDRLIKLKINVRAQTVTGPDGKNYQEGEPVSEKYFDEVLKDAVDRDGDKVFAKGGEAS